MRARAVALGVVVVVLLSGGSCDKPAAPSTKVPDRQYAPPAGAAETRRYPGLAEQAAAHATDGTVGLFLTWEAESEHKPSCEWHEDRAVHDCELPDPTHEGNTWVGIWEHEQHARPGQVFSLVAEGHGSIKYATCEVAWKGQIFEGVSQGKRCGITVTLS